MLSLRATTKSRNRSRKSFLVEMFQIYSVLQADISKTIVSPLRELFLKIFFFLLNSLHRKLRKAEDNL